ncbi:S-adenosyl-L-methionine-dependent methyltransferase [Lentithecium fluviatile CBS 122367]|uniref:S-adenosyl-L-methionine-dependent methyltransferase n=1 Tax=Lentithecium fluviatile CBS 122367 TaxID=1168545 RepID=A0A6G1JB02_9PLEO|nr:S-adenosyl-L-methionine-dependent methyltransferase [Lentithecium fluviatile CBS 122367]
MAKLPKVPKAIPRKPLQTATPAQLKPHQYRPRPQPPKPSAAETPAIKNDGSLSGMKRIWGERPTMADVRKLSPEQMRTASHTMKVQRWRQWPVMLGGLTAFVMGAYGYMLYNSLENAPNLIDLPADLSDRFDKEAEGYDEKVGMGETMLLLSKRRKDLMRKVRGHVLEVAVGTGRNTAYYRTKQCATVTLLDSSGPMLAVAKRKWKDTHPEYFSRVFFKQQSAIDPITPPYGAQDGYDTVIQTMGLCSTPEPVKLLQNLEAVTKEDGGQILLLEHGKSHYQWINNILDTAAPQHADLHGCWWNKDIGKIVEESGLEVVNLKRYNFGTTWWIELKPRKGYGKKIIETAPDAKSDVAPASEAPVAQAQRPWWSLWS